jgi:hypothetical protein
MTDQEGEKEDELELIDFLEYVKEERNIFTLKFLEEKGLNRHYVARILYGSYDHFVSIQMIVGMQKGYYEFYEQYKRMLKQAMKKFQKLQESIVELHSYGNSVLEELITVLKVHYDNASQKVAFQKHTMVDMLSRQSYLLFEYFKKIAGKAIIDKDPISQKDLYDLIAELLTIIYRQKGFTMPLSNLSLTTSPGKIRRKLTANDVKTFCDNIYQKKDNDFRTNIKSPFSDIF